MTVGTTATIIDHTQLNRSNAVIDHTSHVSNPDNGRLTTEELNPAAYMETMVPKVSSPSQLLSLQMSNSGFYNTITSTLTDSTMQNTNNTLSNSLNRSTNSTNTHGRYSSNYLQHSLARQQRELQELKQNQQNLSVLLENDQQIAEFRGELLCFRCVV